MLQDWNERCTALLDETCNSGQDWAACCHDCDKTVYEHAHLHMEHSDGVIFTVVLKSTVARGPSLYQLYRFFSTNIILLQPCLPETKAQSKMGY